MKFNLPKHFRIYYNKITGSIAFYPALLAISFLLLTWVMLVIDFSEWGKNIKANTSWLSLKDATTARSIISTIAGAIISLTVFSFSMVMIVLNQAASQMTNRVLSSMIGNRFQQTVLGFYIGTIVYALFLLSTIRDISSGVYVPALSIYLLILLTVIDIFLFIYFLDYVTQTVKYETVITRVQKKTMQKMQEEYNQDKQQISSWKELPYVEIKTPKSNNFQGYNKTFLLEICAKEDLYIDFLYPKSTYLLRDIPLLRVFSTNPIDPKVLLDIASVIDFYSGQPIDLNADYGFKQLAEIAIKALSPGINDPGTAVLALHSLSDLLAFRLYNNCQDIKTDTSGIARLYIPNSTFEDLFKCCIYPIWNYGKKDQYIQLALIEMINQLKIIDFKKSQVKIFDDFCEIMKL
ncbi:Uncharacterized membrane protein [Flavobacterium micromati]|uniref:Uncharacterized membrane protein n=1 Tax=Flavobacterium micromati TaxID=229205 RepID=A0A1M5NDD5_9FLAO|nr:DUF2254 domain-containing protein [Flavobacterium micromati]SHG87574.1 Uncharacterized membrane protein [Flavobacterium micromati]